MDRQLLNRATDGTDAPTPGYLYVDIAKNASSNPVACQEIATFLTRKLANKQSANIKWKCLKVLAKTAAAVPRGQFKRAVAQDQSAVAAIRQATNFRGPPDPVRGDEPYQRVRTAAKEALDIVYSDTPQTGDASPYGPTTTSAMGGGGGMSNTYGAPPHQQQGGGYGGGGGGMPGGGGGSRMEGIGNPMFSDPRNDPQPEGFGGIMKEVGESFVGMIKDPLARNADVRIANAHGGMPRPGGAYGGHGGYGGPGPHGSGASPYGRPPPGRTELAQATGGQWTMASNRGPGAVGGAAGGNDSYYKSREQGNNAFNWANNNKDAHGSGSGVGGSWAAQTPAPSSNVAGQARAPSYAEQQHSATPSSMTVNHGGGGTAVSDGSYEKNLIMELCPPGGMKPVPPAEKLANFAKAVPNLNPDLICPIVLDNLEDGHPWIMRAKALCVMETCITAGTRPDNTNPYATFFYTCREEIEPLASHARPAVRDPARRVLKLMGIDSAAPVAAPVAAAAPPAAAPVNLLDFDDEPAPTPAAPPAAPAADGASMFGGLQVKSGATAPTPAKPPTSGNLLDGLNVHSPAPAAPPAEPTDMFASMTIKSKESNGDEEKKSTSNADDLKSMVVPGGSAFGFMNEPANATPAAAATTPANAAAAAPATFDPMLAGFSPNTAKAMMSVSQEQMQAMAYQQMLMQQQAMQMQQMQMAMAMQNGGMPRVMPTNHSGVGVGPGVMGPHAGKTSAGFSFLDKPAKKEDHTFDFVQDAMKNSKK